jgi:hypothetical protein
MFDKMVFGLLLLLISSGMGLGIAKNNKNQTDNPSMSSDQIQYSGVLKWDADPSTLQSTVSHLSMDEIVNRGNDFINNYKTGIEIVRVIETPRYFYIAFRETATGVGAFELLANPVTGQMEIENGPSQFWNTKYGVWGSGKSMNNGVSAGQALSNAFMFLKKENALASIDPDPIAFYGYYSFFEHQDGQIIGVISVNGYTGEVEPHTWLGKVLQTREFSNKNS